MKKFEFRLQSALRVRHTQLEMQRHKLQALVLQEQQIQHALTTLAEERRDAIAWTQNADVVTSPAVRALSAYMLGSEARGNAYREQLSMQARLIQDQRIKVLEAERNVRLLEKLRDKRFHEWNQELEREIETTAQDAWVAAQRGRALHSG